MKKNGSTNCSTIVLCVFALCLCSCYHESDAQQTKEGYQISNNAAMEESGLNRHFDSNSQEYKSHLALIAVPGLVLASVSFVLGLVHIFQMCRKKEGDDEEDDDDYEVKKNKYSWCEVTCGKIMVVTVFICLVICTVLAVLATSHVDSATGKSVATLDEAVKTYNDVIQTAHNSYLTINPNPAPGTNGTETTGDKFKNIARTVDLLSVRTAEMRGVEDVQAYWYVYGVRAVFLFGFCSAALIMSAAFMRGEGSDKFVAAAGTTGICCFFIVACMWMLFSMHLVVAVSAADMCPSVTTRVVAGEATGGSASAVDTIGYLATCSRTSSNGNPVIVSLLDEAKTRRERVRHEYESKQAEADTSEEHKAEVTRLGTMLVKLNKYVPAMEAAVDCTATKAAYDSVLHEVCGKAYHWVGVMVGALGASAFFLSFDIYFGLKGADMFSQDDFSHRAFADNTELDVHKNREDFPGM